MSDRELLEFAAKAAGITVEANDKNDWMREKPQHPDDPWRWWNPLENDGDALRLAVKLNLSVNIGTECSCASIPPHKTWLHESPTENHNGAPHKATRRAIVRAAAEIGKSL